MNNTVTQKSIQKEKQDLLMAHLTDFFVKDKSNINQMLPIVREESPISLRIIDWFATNYAKKHNIVYTIQDENGWSNPFNVHLSYKAQLKAYSKKQFDPFRRRQRITFYYEPKKCISTTVGQLNFFRWAIKNDVLKYVHDNMAAIENDMIQSMQSKKQTTNNNNNKSSKSSSSSKRKKRKELSISATKTVTRQHVKVIVSFD